MAPAASSSTTRTPTKTSVSGSSIYESPSSQKTIRAGKYKMSEGIEANSTNASHMASPSCTRRSSVSKPPQKMMMPESPGLAHDAKPNDVDDRAKRRSKARDEHIRKQATKTLTPRGTQRSTSSSLKEATPTTTRSTSKALVFVDEDTSLLEACTLMAATRHDALLVVQGERLTGILTDKDIVLKGLAKGDMGVAELRTTRVAHVMTRQPKTMSTTSSRNEGLAIMLAGRFRHLPIVTAEGVVLRVMDIAESMHDALRRLQRLQAMADRLGTLGTLERSDTEEGQGEGELRGFDEADPDGFDVDGLDDSPQWRQLERLARHLQQQLAIPTVASVLQEDGRGPPIMMSFSATVHEAMVAMERRGQTAVLLQDRSLGAGLVGILTTKDIVLRVLAAGLDPKVTTLARVMTPHPDVVPAEASILEALQLMFRGRYLHLPVLQSGSWALVDVLGLTLGMLHKLGLLDGGGGGGTRLGVELDWLFRGAEDGPVLGPLEEDGHGVSKDLEDGYWMPGEGLVALGDTDSVSLCSADGRVGGSVRLLVQVGLNEAICLSGVATCSYEALVAQLAARVAVAPELLRLAYKTSLPGQGVSATQESPLIRIESSEDLRLAVAEAVGKLFLVVHVLDTPLHVHLDKLRQEDSSVTMAAASSSASFLQRRRSLSSSFWRASSSSSLCTSTFGGSTFFGNGFLRLGVLTVMVAIFLLPIYKRVSSLSK